MKLRWRRQTLAYAHPWQIARSSASTGRQTIVVTVEADGIEGYGEVAPSRTFGQSLESAETALAAVREAVGDRSPEFVENVLADLLPLLSAESATLCAVDAALYDWLGKALGQPVHRLLGIDPGAMPPTSFTIGIDTPEIMAAKTREAASGWKVLKIKLDERPADEILGVICAAYDGPVRVDANTAWTPDTAADQIERLRPFPVELVEQPFPVGMDAALGWFRETCPVPLLVDESFRQVGDLPGLIGRVDGINVKLSKCGGIRQALAAIVAARRHGMKVMLGCMTQSSLGIAAAAQVAPLVDYVDLDGHLLLRDDPWTGLGVQDGCLTLSSAPGLGVRPAAG